MKRLALFSVLAGLLMWASPAAALEEYQSYFGFDYMLTDFEEDGGDGIDLDAAAVRFGSYLSQNTALEARLGFSLSDTREGGRDYELDNFVGLYARGILPYQTVELYGVVGVTRADMAAGGSTYPADGEEVGFSYGAGVDFKVGERLAVGLEYMMLIDSSDYDLTTINIGGKYYF
ncbi:MAG: outer membrane beta-barrel protein [Desulfuromonadales bacterium]|nr:outer membrane beta-barrel protein [Desulfuromonadales bacterium]